MTQTGTFTDAQARLLRYLTQNHGGQLTPAQRRRLKHKTGHAAARDNGSPARRRRIIPRLAGEGWGTGTFIPTLARPIPLSPAGHLKRRLSGRRTGHADGITQAVRDTSGKRTGRRRQEGE